MKIVSSCIFVAFLVAPLLGQQLVATGPRAAVASPLFEAGAGYTYFALDS